MDCDVLHCSLEVFVCGRVLIFCSASAASRFYITPSSFVANNFWLELTRKDKEAGN